MSWSRFVLPVAPPVAIASAFMLKGYYITPGKHSAVLAIWSLGPWEYLRSVPWKIELMLKYIPLMWAAVNSRDHLSTWKSRPSDVIVAVPTKSGTTWLLQIAHQLRVQGAWGGDFSFDDQMHVIPWLEGGAASLLPENDLNKVQVVDPRLFKSHLRYRQLPANVRYVYCFRDLKDVLVSEFYFIVSMVPSDVPLELWVVSQVLPGRIDRALYDLCDWWEHRHDASVCLFFFDDLRLQHYDSVVRLQHFIGIPGGSELAMKVVAQSTHEFMSSPENHTKFDDHMIITKIDQIRGYSRDGPLVGKVRRDGGVSGHGKETLPLPVQEWIDWRWKCIVQQRLGFSTLAEMRQAWAHELAEQAERQGECSRLE